MKNIFIKGFAFLILLFPFLSLAQFQPLIENGKPLGNKLPAMGRLTSVAPSGQQAFCSSILIGPRTVLTAAHCCNKSHSNFNLGYTGTDVSSINPHPSFKLADTKTYNHDICLVILKSSVAIKPISMSVNPLTNSTDFIAVGMTKPSSPPAGISSYGYYLPFDLYSLDSFQGRFYGAGGVRPGDSGGALLIRSKTDQQIWTTAVTSTMILKSSYDKLCNSTKMKFAVLMSDKKTLAGANKCFTDKTEAEKFVVLAREDLIKQGYDPEILLAPINSVGATFAPLSENIDFINSIVSKKGLQICGLNLNCSPLYL